MQGSGGRREVSFCDCHLSSKPLHRSFSFLVIVWFLNLISQSDFSVTFSDLCFSTIQLAASTVSHLLSFWKVKVCKLTLGQFINCMTLKKLRVLILRTKHIFKIRLKFSVLNLKTIEKNKLASLVATLVRNYDLA